MRATILITRPEPAASASCTTLALRGVATILAPVLTLQSKASALPDCATVRGVIFTSANAVLQLPYTQLPRGWAAWPCFCVGAATATVAAQTGWQKAISADSDGAALAALLLAQQPGRQVWLHPCGVERRAEPAATLHAHGHTVLDWEVYDTAAVSDLPAKALAALRAQTCAGALFYSPRSAEIFGTLLARVGLADTAGTMTAWCLSPAIAAAARASRWQAIVTADSPDEAALLCSLQNWLRQEKMQLSA